jgi:hypothetical protein
MTLASALEVRLGRLYTNSCLRQVTKTHIVQYSATKDGYIKAVVCKKKPALIGHSILYRDLNLINEITTSQKSST